MTSCIYLVFTQQSRNASASLLKHTSNIVSSEDKYQLQKHITSLVPNAKICIESSNMKELGELVRESYESKKQLNGHSSNSPVHTGLEAISDLFTDSSIWGYKLLGAGGGGFFAVIGDPISMPAFLQNVGLQPIPVSIDFAGCKIFKSSEAGLT